MRESTAYTGSVPAYGEPWPTNADTLRHNSIDRPHIVLREAIGTLRDVFFGWQVPSSLVQDALRTLDNLVLNRRLPILEFHEVMASVGSSPLLSEGLKAQLLNLAPPPDAVDNKTLKASAIKDVIAEHCATLPTRMSESLFDY